MKHLARILRALADETRLQVLVLLLEADELCVCDIEDLLGIPQSRASRHLRRLLDAGLVDDRREGRWVYYRLRGAPGSIQERIVALLPSLLGGEAVRELRARFRAWLGAKDSSPRSCRLPKPRHRGDGST